MSERKSVGCMICGEELVYTETQKELDCVFCGKKFPSICSCPSGHYVCDSCHSGDAVSLIEQLCLATPLKDPLRIAMNALDLPSVHAWS